MDNYTDLHRYYTLTGHPSFRNDILRKRKVLHARILKLSPGDHLQYEKMGKMLASWGQVQKSIFPLNKAIIIEPSKPKIHIALANALLKLKKEKECFFVILKVLSSSRMSLSKNFELNQLLIKTLEKQNKSQDIESLFEEFANKIKDDPERLPYFYFKSAEILLKFNKRAAALVNYKKAIETNTHQLSYYYAERYYSQYAMTLMHEGFFEEAIIQFENILKISPKHALSVNSIAHCHYCLGKVEKALEEYEYIIKNNLQGYGTYSGIILVLSHLEKDEEVIEEYNKKLQSIEYIQDERMFRKEIYQVELGKTEVELKREDLDEETRNFNERKQKGCNKVLDLLK